MIGQVPDGWRVEKLGKLCQVFTGKKDANHGEEDGKYPFFTCSAKPIKSNTYSFSGKSILLAGNGNLKNMFLYDGDFEAYQRTYVIQNLDNSLLYEYLFFNLKKYWVRYNASKQFGSIINYIKMNNIIDYSIPIPPLSQQEKIIKVLDISSTLIEKQKENIEKYNLFLKSKFIEMFGDPINNPMGWEVEKLGEISNEIRYGTNEKSSKQIENSVPVLRIPNIGNRCLNYKDMKYSILSNKEYEKLKLEKGNLLFVRTNGNPKFIGKCISFEEDFDCVYASYLIRVKLKNQKILPKFIEFILAMPTYRQLVLKEAKTTAGNYNINTQSIKKFKLINPPIELQNKFASIIEKIEAINEQENKKLAHLETLHNSLMDKAFKGEIQ